MKPQNTLILFVVALVLIALFFWRKANAAKSLTFALNVPFGFRVQNAALYFTLPIRVLNGSPDSLRISGLNLKAYFKNNELGTVYALKAQDIAALSESIFNADVFIPLVNLTYAIPDIKLKETTIPVRFVGNVRAFGISFPVDYTQNLRLPKL